jgi:hypothetical protein
LLSRHGEKSVWLEKKIGIAVMMLMRIRKKNGKQIEEANEGVGKEQAPHGDRDQSVRKTDCGELKPSNAGAMDLNMVFMIPVEF